nr:MAG TPA: hypothetical protein [Caudoviricetes sp.]
MFQVLQVLQVQKVPQVQTVRMELVLTNFIFYLETFMQLTQM